MSSVAVIILNFNTAHQTVDCIESVAGQSYKNLSVVVVDNNSDDTHLLDKYLSHHTHIYIKNQQNMGFAGGVNTGIKYALQHEFEYIILLNNDAKPDKDWIKNLVAYSDKVNSDITTGLMLSGDGKTIDSSGEQYSIWGLPFPGNRNKPADLAPESSLVFGATGGGSLYRASLFRKIGLFDEDFFAYYEDTDISFRAQLAGLKVHYTKDAILYHQQGGTFNKYPRVRTTQHFKNLPLLYIKNIPSSLLISVGVRLFIAYNLMFFKATLHGAGAPALKGWLQQLYLFWFHALPARVHIQRHKKVSATYIKSILWPDLPPDQTGLRKLRARFTGRDETVVK